MTFRAKHPLLDHDLILKGNTEGFLFTRRDLSYGSVLSSQEYLCFIFPQNKLHCLQMFAHDGAGISLLKICK